MTTQTTYKLSKRFVNDHAKRGCLTTTGKCGDGSQKLRLLDVLVKETKSHYFVSLNEGQANELMSDADYYGYYSDQPDIGLRMSARATVKVLEANGITRPKSKW